MHSLSAPKVEQLIPSSKEQVIWFYWFYSEQIDKQDKWYFNGNLFRKNQLGKTNAVLSSLKSEEQKKN